MRSDYLTPDYLASDNIDTPDPRRLCFYGQQVVVNWALAKSCLAMCPILQLTVRFGDRSLETFQTELKTERGFWVYQLVNESYIDKEGILSYKAEIFTPSGEEIAEWRHHVWAEIVDVCDEDILLLDS